MPPDTRLRLETDETPAHDAARRKPASDFVGNLEGSGYQESVDIVVSQTESFTTAGTVDRSRSRCVQTPGMRQPHLPSKCRENAAKPK